MVAIIFSCSAPSEGSLSRITAFNSITCRGLRISWDMWARNRPLAWLARSDSSLDSRSSRVRVATSSSSLSRWARSSVIVAATRAPRAEYSRDRKNARQSTLITCGKAPAYGARTFAKSTRNPIVNPTMIAVPPIATRIAPVRSRFQIARAT